MTWSYCIAGDYIVIADKTHHIPVFLKFTLNIIKTISKCWSITKQFFGLLLSLKTLGEVLINLTLKLEGSESLQSKSLIDSNKLGRKKIKGRELRFACYLLMLEQSSFICLEGADLRFN